MSAIIRNLVSKFSFTAIFVLFAAITGCSSSNEAQRVDPVLAKSTLETALDGWKRGDPISDYQKNSSSVVVQDRDWSAGAKLVAYKCHDSGDALDANMFCKVRLTLEDVQGNQTEREVTYVVGTSPVRTVFRSFFP